MFSTIGLAPPAARPSPLALSKGAPWWCPARTVLPPSPAATPPRPSAASAPPPPARSPPALRFHAGFVRDTYPVLDSAHCAPLPTPGRGM
eukprot:1185940-Prorocentrum_minimum.AAC.5